MNRLSTTGPFALTFSPNITGSLPTHQKDLKHHKYKKTLLIKINLPELVLPATMPNNSATATIFLLLLLLVLWQVANQL